MNNLDVICENAKKINELFRESIMSKLAEYVPLVKQKEDGKYGLEAATTATLLTIGFEIGNALHDLSVGDRAYLHLNQRRTYFSIRYAMEAMSDLIYLEKFPEEKTNFITGPDFNEKIQDLSKIKDPIERDKATADILRLENKLSGTTISRVGEAFPHGGLTQYSMLCLFAHNNDLGHQLAARLTTRDYAELYYYSISTIKSIVEEIVKYVTSKSKYGIKIEDCSELIARLDYLVGALYKVLFRQKTALATQP